MSSIVAWLPPSDVLGLVLWRSIKKYLILSVIGTLASLFVRHVGELGDEKLVEYISTYLTYLCKKNIYYLLLKTRYELTTTRGKNGPTIWITN